MQTHTNVVFTPASLLKKPAVMPSETVTQLLEFDIDFDETELTLRLPGAEFRPKERNNRSNAKRGFQDTIEIDLSVGSCGDNTGLELISSGSNSSSTGIDNGSKLAVTGWPPVRSYRRKTMIETNCNFKYIKVAVDGAPYLRKIDLEMFKSYKDLLKGLEKLCACFPICCDYLEECNIISNPMKGADHEYLPTYEDKDGDWMLVGDVPWKLFIESCKRIRLMKGSMP